MRVAILHNAVASGDSQSDRDVLVQIDSVRQSLARLGHTFELVPVTLDLESLVRRLPESRPDVVFNLVESLGGSDRLAFMAPAVLDLFGLAYTGSSTEALFLTIDKLTAKSRIREAGLPTPEWLTSVGDWSIFRREDVFGRPTTTESMDLSPSATRFIIKPVWEHASLGMDAGAVVDVRDAAELAAKLADRAAKNQCPCFAERFVEGREFNLSVLASAAGPEVLPPAEIDFSAFAEGAPRIVGYEAKWDEGSFEFHNTPRTFDFPPTDRDLLEELSELARACWRLFGLGGYARVDFRVDAAGRPWILEINANACLSPDAGFAAAVERAGIGFDHAVERILNDAVPRQP
jgi:D-alanine-D-alanine ligase